MTRAEILDCLTDRPCDSCKFHESGRCERWDCVFEEKPDDVEPCKVGCWIHTDECDEEWQYRCSICNMPSKSNSHRYCSNCGSYMYGIKPDDAEDCEDKRMTREEAIAKLKNFADHCYPNEEFLMAIEALSAEPCRETDDYENEIADLQNRLDIAEYDRDRWKERVTVMEEKLKALSAEPCEGCISRQAVHNLMAKLLSDYLHDEDREKIENTDAQIADLPSVTPNVDPCEDTISRQAAMNLMRGLTRWCVRSEDGKFNNVGLLYDDVMFGLDRLPSVTPKQKMGRWVKVTNGRGGYECDVCRNYAPSYKNGDEWLTRYCPNCSAKMEEGNGWND